jgi:twitching motility protein PilI
VPKPAEPPAPAPTPAGQALLDGLKALEARCLRDGVGLPQREPPPRVWTMVVFRVAGRTLLAPLEQVAEVLTVPTDITRVPGTKPWVMGVANNRGTLLPIYDVEGWLTGTPTRRTAQERVLVVRQEELPFGILVGGPVGIHHCQANMAITVSPGTCGALGPLIEGGYLRGTERLPVANLGRLTALPQLASAAA